MNANPLALFWEGFTIESYTQIDSQSLLIRLQPAADCLPCCSGCSQHTLAVHDTSIRRVRERDLFHYRVWLEVPVRRVRCVACGPRLEQIRWLSGRQRLTVGMIHWVESLVRLMPVQHVAQLLGLHWHTVKAIDHRRLTREVIEPDRRRLRRLIMDEFALFKGHRYATVVINADTQQVLWVGEGRSRAAVRPFFEWLGPEACARIEAVAMDMNTALDLEVQHHCPQACVVYDLFHVVAKFGREVIDRVRVDQANQLRHDKSGRQVIKRSRWLLLRNKDNLRDEQALKLDELLQANQPLMTVYVLKDQLKELWYAPSEEDARKRWKDWFRLALSSGLPSVQQFARRLKRYLNGIVASARYRMHTSVLEGMNNKIKVIKRMAYGYRDNDYFFLKIKAAFPGKVR
ncbi:ISL3 family transposase [Marinobacter sp. R17]|uniref:ISL3 family transposase n=1 Tax=Marinobacter sp. R17 TaxID=2484250 RepID=UPI000F4CE54B|nr:ISL3 family transposase [Marinobacter sp. R17]ROT93287.1 ISL3 family transposase [Marinobacter sp. R17]